MTATSSCSLQEPRRNRYFYGKLLDVANFRMEQCYGIDKRWLLNRLALGPGVLCGLGVTAGVDGTLCISPGVAIDGCGREIVVPAAVPSVDPAQPTDPLGKPAGGRLVGGQSTIYLCYTECDTDPTAVYVSECDGSTAQAASTTVERFRVIVTAGLPAAEPPKLSAAQYAAIYPDVPPQGFDRRVATEQTMAITCPDPPDPSCVVLATVTLPDGDTPLAVDEYAYRAEVFSNTVLFELIAALADRVDACCAALHPAPHTITITDGDGQDAPVRQQLPAPVHLLVSTPNGDPAAAVQVEVSTADADARLSVDGGASFAPDVTAATGADGVVTVTWQLGSVAGAQSFAATLVAGGASVRARANGTETGKAPVVIALDPANGSTPGPDFRADPSLGIAFDHDMDPAGLADPDPWLRAWAFDMNADGQLGDGRRLKLAAGDPPTGSRSRFRAEPINLDRFAVVVMMRGGAPQIVSAVDGLALDADYQGTELTADMLDHLWNSDGEAASPDFSARLHDSGAALPSGDGTPGGQFHSFFTVTPQ